MTDMEIDNTEEKKSGYAALREKHAQEIESLQAKIDELTAGRMADKKLYFENTMRNKGYEGDFNAFADKYSSLDINDMVSLYEGQNGRVVHKEVQEAQSQTQTEPSIGAKSVITGANPTTEVGGKKINELSTDELIKFAKTQPWFHN